MAETKSFDYSNPYVPAELLRALHGVESTFGTDTRTSPAGAVGPFQFQEATGKEYGLQTEQDRRDFEKSKLAAGKYLAKLYQDFGDWEGAFRAYNAGPTKYKKIKAGISKSPENEAYFGKILKLLSPETRAKISSRGTSMDVSKTETPSKPTRSLDDIVSLGTKLFDVTAPQRREADVARQEIAGIESQIAERKGELEQRKAKGVREIEQQADVSRRAAMTEYEQAKEARPIPAFAPTRDSAEDLAKLFSFIGVMGTLLGKGGGKQAAMGAMSAMTGMMEGWQKGRMDLYNQEKAKFEKDFAQVNKIHEELYKKMKDAVSLASTNKELGQAKLNEALAKSGSDILKMTAQLQGPQAVLKRLEESTKGINESMKTAAGYLEKDRAAEARERAIDVREQQGEARLVIAEQNLQLARERLELATKKAEEKKEGKTLPDKQVRDLEGLNSIAAGLEQLKKDFKPEYASLGIFGIGADLQFEAMRRLGKEEAQKAISWWSRYDRLQAPNRHALFGATLTGNERQNYLQFTAKKSDSAETVLTMLSDQIAYSTSLAASKIMTAEGAGYKVPKVETKDYFGTYGSSGGETIKVGEKEYTRPVGFTDDQWNAYKKSVGAK